MLRAMRAVVIAAFFLAASCGGARTDGGSPPPRTSRFGMLKRQLDLFDAARFERNPALRPDLERELRLPAGSLAGADATDRAADALLVEADRILAADRLDEGAQQARTLIELDRRPPERAELWRRMMEVKVIARGAGPLAPNARLRLAAYCWRALDDARKTTWRLRIFAVSHCLYPLYDSDPEPYFSRDPAQRPPPPDWRKLVSRARDLFAEPFDSWGRLEGARRRVMADLEALLFVKAEVEMPLEPEPTEGAPAVPGAAIHDWPPLAGMTVRLAQQVDRLKVELQADSRGALGLIAPPGATGADLLAAAAAARAAGAEEVVLFVYTEQTLQPPPGDYWLEDHRRAARAATIALSLAPLGATAGSGAREPRRVEFEGGLRLHLMIAAGKWTLLSPDGVLAELPAGDAQLVTHLANASSAFPDEASLVLVVDPAATVSGILAAAAAAAYRDGKPFLRLGLGTAAPRAKVGPALAKRIALRSAATVAIQPEALAPHAAAARACYQEALEKSPSLAGTVRLEAAAGSVVRIGPANETLTRCATQALGGAMKAQQTGTADVTFSVKR